MIDQTARALLGSALIGMAFASAAAAATGGAGEAPPRFTAERILDLEYAADPQISPNGRTIVYVRRSMDRLRDRVDTDLWTLDVATGAHRPLVVGPGPAAAPRWSPRGDRIVYASAADGRAELRVLYLDTGRSFALAQFDQPPGEAAWSPDGARLAFSMLVPDKAEPLAKPPAAPEGATWAPPVRLFDDLRFRIDGEGYLTRGDRQVFVISAEGGAPRAVTEGAGDFSSPEWLGNDALLVVGNDAKDADLDPVESEIYRIDVETGARVALTTRDGPDAAPAVSPDGRRIAFLGYDDKVKAYQETDLYVMSADGSGVRNLTAGYGRSIDAIAWRPDGRSLLAQVETDGRVSIMDIPLDGGAPRRIVDDLGGTDIGRPYVAGSFSVAETGGARPVIAYTLGREDRPADVATVRAGERARRLTDLNEDALGHLALGKVEAITVPSSHDGLPIQAWVVTPPDFRADGTFPMILEIHGGPFAMYGPTFAAEIQRFAADGYVVVYANPRGSTGYGEAFAQKIDRAYPGNDHDDLMSVVDHLVANKTVDPKRLFITGGSGGGVLTSWAIGKTDRFAAAAVAKPVINWTSQALASDISAYVMRHWMQVAPWEDPQHYWRLSPLSLVGNVKTPTLVLVGEEDWRTPTWESEQYYTALKLRGVDTMLLRFPGASHAMVTRPSQLIAKPDNILGWFARHDPARSKED